MDEIQKQNVRQFPLVTLNEWLLLIIFGYAFAKVLVSNRGSIPSAFTVLLGLWGQNENCHFIKCHTIQFSLFI